MKKIKELFYIKYGNSLSLQDCELSNNGIPFIARGSKNNGITARVNLLNNVKLNKENTISVSVSGSILEAFLQKEPYYTSYHIFILEPKYKMTDIEMLFYCMCIRANKYKYNYGRQANKTLKDLLIPDIDEIPKYIYNYKLELPNNNSIFDSVMKINISKWSYFKISELFDIKGSKTTSPDNIPDFNNGIYPYVTTQAINNGVAGFFDFYTEEGNVITVDSAVIGYAAYQEFPFSASDHVEKLIPKFLLNKYIAMFLVTILNKEQYRYSYGRKASQNRLKNTYIMLPSKLVNNKYEPDWEYMENYIKSLPYSSSI